MPDAVVCGAGVVGLCAAVELQQRGWSVDIVAREAPAATTSAVAGAIWYPYLAEPRDAVQDWSLGTFVRLAEFARDRDSGVTMLPVEERLVRDQHAPTVPTGVPWTIDEARVARTTVPMCDTRRYLPFLLQRFRDAGGTLHQRELKALDEAFDLAPVVVNCTGLGAGPLCGDRDLVPVRGQVVLATGARCATALIDDTGPAPVYVLPRGDELVLGGTAQRGDARTEPDDADTARILADCRARLPALAAAEVKTVKVGLRPYRSEVRLEREDRSGGRVVVHDYGHGGSGFTLSWGCAAEVAALLQRR